MGGEGAGQKVFGAPSSWNVGRTGTVALCGWPVCAALRTFRLWAAVLCRNGDNSALLHLCAWVAPLAARSLAGELFRLRQVGIGFP